jgi:hypothetical protein
VLDIYSLVMLPDVVFAKRLIYGKIEPLSRFYGNRSLVVIATQHNLAILETKYLKQMYMNSVLKIVEIWTDTGHRFSNSHCGSVKSVQCIHISVK